MFYAGGPVFACFVLNAPEPANPFLSAEKEYKNPVSLIIPNTQLELSPSLTPTWNTPTPQKRSLLPGGLERFGRASDCCKDHRPALFSPSSWWRLDYLPGSVERSSLQRMLRGLLLAQPQV